VRISTANASRETFSESKIVRLRSQLHQAMQQVAEAARGVILYMRQEGAASFGWRIAGGTVAKGRSLDTVQAKRAPRLWRRLRHLRIGAQILIDLGFANAPILTNNPKTVVAGRFGLQIVEPRAIEIAPNQNNRRYLRTKKEKLGI